MRICLPSGLNDTSKGLGEHGEEQADASFCAQIAVAAQEEVATQLIELAIHYHRFHLSETVFKCVIATIAAKCTIALRRCFLVQMVVDDR